MHSQMASTDHSSVCGACFREVKQGLQCEGMCMHWFHCRCVFGIELTAVQYKKLSMSNEQWHCANCTGGYDSVSSTTFNRMDAIDVFHFDFQQNLPTPKLTVGKQFYLRLLWTYLFGIHSSSCNITTAFMWNELVAHRGASDVIYSLNLFSLLPDFYGWVIMKDSECN